MCVALLPLVADAMRLSMEDEIRIRKSIADEINMRLSMSANMTEGSGKMLASLFKGVSCFVG